MKIAVYAICKNEAKHVDRWMDSLLGADGIYVLDTGSTDGTIELLQAYAPRITLNQHTFNPWRFDHARNLSLDLVPTFYDWVFAVDLDEVLDAGWRETVEKTISENPGCNRMWYQYVWNHNADGTPATTLFKEKCHTRTGFRWFHPVHEILRPDSTITERYATCHGFTLHHYADDSKPRTSYLPLLELSVAEEPDDDRNAHYLGREYHFRGQHDKAITELKRHLQLPKAVWKPERANSMRYISRSYAALNLKPEAIRWAMRACAEAPDEREPWLQLAYAYNGVDNHEGCWFAVQQMLRITERPRTYISEPESWGADPYDLAAVSAYYLGDRDKALLYSKLALELDPTNPRLIENLRCISADPTEGE